MIIIKIALCGYKGKTVIVPEPYFYTSKQELFQKLLVGLCKLFRLQGVGKTKRGAMSNDKARMDCFT